MASLSDMKLGNNIYYTECPDMNMISVCGKNETPVILSVTHYRQNPSESAKYLYSVNMGVEYRNFLVFNSIPRHPYFTCCTTEMSEYIRSVLENQD
jgi:hypothetical protein